MRRLLLLALGASALLTTTSAQAHSHPIASTHLVPAVAHTIDEYRTDSVAALANPTTGPTVHVSTSHPPVGSFHSAPVAHSFAPAPSRSFTFSRASSPSISTRPATPAPRTYTYSISGVPRTKTYTPVSSPPAEVHHYHSSGGMSITDAIVLNAALNNSRQAEGSAVSNARLVSAYQASPETLAPDDGLSGWQIFGITFLIVGLAVGFCYLLNKLTETE